MDKLTKEMNNKTTTTENSIVVQAIEQLNKYRFDSKVSNIEIKISGEQEFTKQSSQQ